MGRFSSRVLLIICLQVILLDGSPVSDTACPDLCPEELESRRNLTSHIQTFEVTELAAVCGYPSNDAITISWNVPSHDRNLLAGYRVLWYTNKLYCRCVDKLTRSVVISNGSTGYVFPGHVSFMVKPLPRPHAQETFQLIAVHCMKESKNATIHPEEVEPNKEEIKTRYIVVSIGVAIGVFLTLMSYVLWSRLYKNKHQADQDKEQEKERQKLVHMLEDPVYVSYHSSDQALTEQVHEMSCWLIEQGVHIIMDRMFSCEMAEMGIIQWCDQQMSRAKKVLIVCSNSFLKVCKLRDQLIQAENGVPPNNLTSEQLKTMQEIACIKRDMFLSGHCADRFIVVLLGVQEEKLPVWLREFPVSSWPLERDNLVALINDQGVVKV